VPACWYDGCGAVKILSGEKRLLCRWRHDYDRYLSDSQHRPSRGRLGRSATTYDGDHAMKQGHLTGLRRALQAKNQRSAEQLAEWLEDLHEAYVAAAAKSPDAGAARKHNEGAEKAGQAAALLRTMADNQNNPS
jgi:hypothetical protein